MHRPSPGFGDFVARHRAARTLIVQPRMGFSDPLLMRAGLAATRTARAATAGTVTVDSYTRTGDLAAAATALANRQPLNGYPIVNHSAETTQHLLAGLHDADFPVQVRHGSANPVRIITSMIAAGLSATEGGPISYCLPYSRMPLRQAVAEWARSCRLLSHQRETGAEPHLESFGGCMLGQLCPPSMLIAITVLEAMFFRQNGLRSVSLSYAQQTDFGQDHGAIAALRAIAAERLGDLDWHIVLYTYMGLFPASVAGASRLQADAATLAAWSGVDRLIVKTSVEARRLPSVAENVEALEAAAAVAAAVGGVASPVDDRIRTEAETIIDSVLDLRDDIGGALVEAFDRGRLDVPYCLHPDNPGRATSRLDQHGRLQWLETGGLAISGDPQASHAKRISSAHLLESLSYVRRRYDHDLVEER
ncbi:methylaspartate mutase [Micromonospora sp. AKA38]|uniref:methylaspartate mutase n=1 Tax=Micromonospora sp. AKA38 TaxID=2733861 RepID=UPI0022BE0653|nr:methylaspartate mutase [Micromonospora sp. AKA38]GHJ15500.1 methylaspartate mutase [Micromonospora sp. AKA38]